MLCMGALQGQELASCPTGGLPNGRRPAGTGVPALQEAAVPPAQVPDPFDRLRAGLWYREVAGIGVPVLQQTARFFGRASLRMTVETMAGRGDPALQRAGG